MKKLNDLLMMLFTFGIFLISLLTCVHLVCK
jgi:hypothetical protein